MPHCPTDNDTRTVEGAWRQVGGPLAAEDHRARAARGGIAHRLKIAPAGGDSGFPTVLIWTADSRQPSVTLLSVRITPDGTWGPLPRIGLLLMLDAGVKEVSWFGRGPGEAYRDTFRATRVGRFNAPVSAMATLMSGRRRTATA